MRRLLLTLTFVALACGLFLQPRHHPTVAKASPPTPPVLCIVFVPDIQFLTAQGGGSQNAMNKAMTWAANTTASTFGCTVEAVVGEGDQINTPCNATNSSHEEAQAFIAWSIINTAGIRWSVAAGNHEFTSTGTSRVASQMSESWKDSPNSGNCAFFSTPGDFSPAAFVTRALGYTSSSQFWAQGAVGGINQNSYMRWTPAGYHGVMVVSLNFFATQGELDAAAVFINANPNDDVILVTHAAMNPTDNTNHVAQYLDYTCGGTFCNAFYTLDATNSRSGVAIRDWAKGFRNVVGIVSGHYFVATSLDGNWSSRSDTATDGHSIFGVHGDWQSFDVSPPVNSAGTSITYASQTGGSGTCPNINSTGCNAEIGFLMPLVIDTGAGTAKFYALSTNTGHWVNAGNSRPQAATSMAPIATFAYAGTPNNNPPSSTITGTVSGSTTIR